MTAVESRAIAEVGYEARSRTLLVRFRSGEAYAYLDVPAAVHDDFLAAPSKGRFFQAEVDPAFRFVRLEASRLSARPRAGRARPARAGAARSGG